VSSKFAGIFGPLIYGLIIQLTGNIRLSILSLIVFFITGMILLSRVDVARGQAAAIEAELA
jgi:UMF1 family MFS transporter